MYTKPLRARRRRIPCAVSLTYRTPAAFAEASGSARTSTGRELPRRARRRDRAFTIVFRSKVDAESKVDAA
jgi:hypothetical protein